MTTVDREAHTPRESSTWEFQAGIAQGLSQQVRDEEIRLGKVSPALDVARSNMLRHLRQVLDHYAATFAGRATHPVAVEQRAREQAEFSALTRLAQVVLEVPR